MFRRNRIRPILQAEATECGLACLAMVFANYRRHVTLSELRRNHPSGDAGLALNRLIEIAATQGFSSRAVRLELDEVRRLKLPAVLHWDYEHYVVLTHIGVRRCRVIDPARGERRYHLAELGRHFTGIALELSPAASFEPRARQTGLTLWRFVQDARELGGYLAKVVVLALLMQGLALASPYYVQTVVDDVLVRHDTDFLLVLALGFATLILLEVLLGTWRRWLGITFGQQLSFTLASNVFDHLLRLPLRWFTMRPAGDITNRFASIESMRSFLSGGLALTVIDGVTAIAFVVVMWIYHTNLTLVVLISVALYLVIRALAFLRQRDLNAEMLLNSAAQTSLFLESIRAIATIKSYGHEATALQRWQRAYTGEVNSGLQLSRLGVGFEQMQILLFGLENTLVVFLGAHAVIDGEAFTVGMLYAFIFYKNNFKDRIAGFIDYLMEYRLLSVHLQRLEDVVGTQPEARPALDRLPQPADRAAPLLEAANLGFRYPTQPPLFEGFNLCLHAGDSVAICGPSGCGKSTLLRVVAGLDHGHTGSLCLRGHTSAEVHVSEWRSGIALVTPEDTLFSGSIRDNVGLFADITDAERLREVGQLTGLSTLVQQLPLGWDTLLGENGLALSAGQRQRILLARALYKAPDLLLLDEATSHLDTGSEALILDALMTSDIAIILVSHRPSVQARADRLITLRAAASGAVSAG